MERNFQYRILIYFVVASLILQHQSSQAQTSEEFRTRRSAVFGSMNDNSVLIMRAHEPPGEFGPFRQENNFFYLTGLSEPNSALIMKKSAGNSEENYRDGIHAILFIQPRNNKRADWDPESLGLEGARTVLGFTSVKPYSDFQEKFESALLDGYAFVYLEYARSGRLNDPLTPDESLLNRAREKDAVFEVLQPISIIGSLRRIKSEAETDNLRTAISITAKAHKEAMRSIKPGIKEYQLQAVVEHVFALNGARPGFNSILASGPNSVVLHWDENSRTMQDGDMVVVDIGAEYEMYTADVTRTLPVNGRFTKRQKEIYSLVLAAQQAGIDMLKPGAEWSDVNNAVKETLREGLKMLGLIREDRDLRHYYYHGLGHSIGLDVHDDVSLSTLEAGMILTVEPGIYIRDEGMGIRIEDDFLITGTGYIHLSKNAPRSIDAIEAVMKESGTDIERYLIKK